ncbi:Inner membrane protein YrbG [Symmachiella macrocystis]|uniref:Inner membrane protein YrbG n=1 Tax=Symmachiella macrocystis TaxID=2527985 RepID=A0A5C6AZ11_9PLAN|nr:calcium/sodium antiporter [Symmachiella macrocystis]TWU05275.1 Inner membrane protein YrbG [Symmachiella macrocystis]
MEEIIKGFINDLPWDTTPALAWTVLLGMIAVNLAVLAKGADWLVEEAVVLSERSGLSKVVIGATVVSLGTTMPEVAVSVFAAVKGVPELALGNAVGSVICDTGLILGISCLIAPLPLHKKIVNRQGWVQLGSGILLVAVSWPWNAPGTAFTDGGHIAQITGFAFLAILAWYIWQSVRWAREEKNGTSLEDFEGDAKASTAWVLSKLAFAVFLVVGSSHLLIPCVEEAAIRMNIPAALISATLVAFGTSLPELVTCVTAARHGHGDLAVGNVIGADILNVLFVTGAAAAVTPQGLEASPQFFRVLFPAMLTVLIVFRVGILFSGSHMKRGFGLVLLGAYLLVNAAIFL